jgi:hypothetical protein
MKRWSHPPELNRRPTDYESIRVKSLLLLFFSSSACFAGFLRRSETPENWVKRMRLDPRADKTADISLEGLACMTI